MERWSGIERTMITYNKRKTELYVWVSVHHKLIYIKNQRNAAWQYVYL